MVEPSDSKIEFFLKINGAYNWITVVKVWLGHLKRAATRISGADRDH